MKKHMLLLILLNLSFLFSMTQAQEVPGVPELKIGDLVVQAMSQEEEQEQEEDQEEDEEEDEEDSEVDSSC